MIGISLLPGLPQKVRDSGMDLPKPASQRGGKKRKGQTEDEFMLQDFGHSINDAINAPSNIEELSYDPGIQALRQLSRCAAHR